MAKYEDLVGQRPNISAICPAMYCKVFEGTSGLHKNAQVFELLKMPARLRRLVLFGDIPESLNIEVG